MISEIFKYLCIIAFAIISILAVIEILKIAVKGPIHKEDRKSKIKWFIVCILYLACALIGCGTVILMLLK